MNNKIKKMSGVITIQATKVNSNESLTIKIDSKLVSGNLEIVIVDPNNQLIKEVILKVKMLLR